MKGFVSVQFFTSKYGIPNNIECLLYKVTKLLYICVSFWLLAHVIYLKLRQKWFCLKAEQIYMKWFVSS
jgi:hypothetical protein